ncbi:unnamed protein product [Tilletia controversa]|uniref:HIT-type domain-containing protein n=1 Tax=Tilletia controversa TaxID=13291 RepID=A0A8X7MXJ8_9BASI|nr:hypothetical protein CF328_g3704 [Tilletia controversa]KAE8252867.1 hypothetical protein A4X06_0g1869 [Tilletia controversa]CAD6931797.1 unnamed protein product [Tilletia controversa]CAD6942511.1 unnamed protein product [Tilletia controversa]CAD7068412.1 unnamed protein product [Tilletia caries]
MSSQAKGGRGGKRVLFDTTRHSKRVVQAVKLGRPETVYQKVLSEAEQVEQLDARQRTAAEAKRRRTLRKLEELERTNHRDAAAGPAGLSTPVEGKRNLAANLTNLLAMRREGLGERDKTVTHDLELQAAIDSSRRGKNGRIAVPKEQWTPAVRKILTTKRTFASLISDAAEFPSMHVAPNYFTAQAARPMHASQVMCSICGYWGQYSCVRCGDRYCSHKCGSTHESARCDQRA